MGLSIIINNADFSAVSVGKFKSIFSITGQTHTFDLNTSFEEAKLNVVADGAATQVGTPTFSEQAMTGDGSNLLSLGVAPLGDLTMLVVFKTEPNVATVKYPLGSFDNPANGACYFQELGTNLSFVATVHDAGGVFLNNATTTLTLPAVENFECYTARMQSTAGVTLNHPRTGGVDSASTPTGYFNYPAAGDFTTPLSANAAQTNEIALVAIWDRVLTDIEIAAAYRDAKLHVAKSGITI